MKRPGIETAVDTARDRLRTALERDPASLAFVGLAQVLLDRGEPDEAVRICRDGLLHHPNHSTGHLLLGLALDKSGQEDDALRAFREVIDLDPGNRLAKIRLGEAYRKGTPTPPPKAPSTARALPSTEEEEEPEGDLGEEIAFFTFSMAEVYEKQGFFEKALTIYQRVLSLQPGREDVRGRIRELRRRMTVA
ncbi:MAG: tetratricopeptide repeat protein [Candidatus Eisenbacteria bacterium]